MRKWIAIWAMVAGALSGMAQEGQVKLFARVVEPGQVELKWYAPELYGSTQYFVERQNGGSWERLNTEAVALAHVPEPEGEEFLPMVEISKREAFSQVDGLMRLAIFLKAVESEELANYFGMYYKDVAAPSANTAYRLVDNNGNALAQVEIHAGSPTKTVAPQNPVLSPGDSMAFIDLEIESEKFYAYNLYRSTAPTGPFEKLNPLPLLASPYDKEEHFFTDRGLDNGTTYYFVSEGLDFFGEPSERSEAVEVTPVDMTPPPAPVHLEARETDNRIVLSWSPVPVPDLIGYRIYRSPKIPTAYQEITTEMLAPDASTFEDSPEGPMVYYYQVRAVDASGNESGSRDVFAEVRDLTAPETPTGAKAVATEGQVTLSWTANEEPDLLGYWVYRSANESRGDKYSLLNASPTLETNFTDPLPKKAKNGFRYYIIALDTNLNQSKPTETIVAYLPDVTPPAAPFIENVQVDEGQATLTYRRPLDSDLASIVLLRKIKGSAAWDSLAVITDFAQPTVTDLPGKGDWEYALVATDSTENPSPLSETYPITVIEAAEAPPITSITVSLGDENGPPSILVSWSADESSNLRGYIVYRKQNGEQFRPVSGLVNETSFTDSNIQAGAEYTYQVRSLSTSGKIAGSEESIIRVNE